MTTTNLFVELVVIGVGAACWVGMLVVAAFGFTWVEAEFFKSYPVLLGMLAGVYLLGIISDRVADYLFDKLFSGPLRDRHFGQKREYQDARRLIFNLSDRLADMHDYGRTRIRICRGWALNAVMIGVCLNILLGKQFSNRPWCEAASILGTLGFALLAFASWWSWRMLCSTEYLKIKEHAEYLRSQNSRALEKIAA